MNNTTMRAALKEVESEITRLQTAKSVIESMLSDGKPHRSTKAKPERKARHLSAAARRRIGDAARKRWAAQRAGNKATPAKATAK